MNSIPSPEQLQVELAETTAELETKPNEPGLYLVRAGIYRLLRQRENAIADFDKAIELETDDSDAYSFRALTLLELYNTQKAEQILSDCDLAEKLDTQSSYPHMVRANLYYLQEKYTDSIQSGTEAIERHSANYSAFLYRGRSYAALENWMEAARDLTKAIEIIPNDSRAYYDRSKAFIQLGMFRAALEDSQRASLFDPKSPLYGRPDLLDLINN